ncbi:hypothetical protein H9643_08015 [Ochrobactrum sp. Sa2BUA5]|nr:hypothetical protein [Ochrobactrum gallinarum]
MKKFGFGGEHSFWSVAIAAALLCLLLGISYGSLFDKEACYGSQFGCIEFWINRYQTLLTAFGVVFAVTVAKAQLEANRRQHVAQIKRSFQDEIDTLDRLETLADSIENYQTSMAYGILALTNPKAFPSVRPAKYYLRNWPKRLEPRLKQLCKDTINACNAAHLASTNILSTDEEISAFIKKATTYAIWLRVGVESEKRHFSQYWS